MNSSDRNDHRLLDDARTAAIQTAANLLAAMAEAKKFRRRMDAARDEDPATTDAHTDRDYLFDLLRLNATYLNELSRMGRTYGDVARQALENLYTLAKPGLGNPHCADELVFSRAEAKKKFVIQNDVNPDATSIVLRWPRLQRPGTGKPVSGLRVEVDGKALRAKASDSEEFVEVPVNFAEPKVVTVVVEFTHYLERRYESWMLVELALGNGKVRRRKIPIIVDGRSKASR